MSLVHILIGVLVAALVYIICMAVGLPFAVALIAALLVLIVAAFGGI